VVKSGVVCLQVKLCDPHLSALEVKFSRRGAKQIYVYLYTDTGLTVILPGDSSSSIAPCPSQTGEGTAVKEEEWRQLITNYLQLTYNLPILLTFIYNGQWYRPLG